MATPDSRNPRRASHFGGASEAPRAGQTGSIDDTMAPLPAAPKGATPRTTLRDGRVSGRTAAATQRATTRTVRRGGPGGGKSRAPLVVLALLAVAAVAAVVLVVVPALTAAPASDGTQEVVKGNQVTITIPEGAGAAAVADELFDAGVIASKSEFLAQARRTNAEQSLKSGSYTLTTGDDLSVILELLTTGPNASAKVTIPEGYTVSQTADAVEQALGIPADEFLAQAKASAYASDFAFLSGAADDSLEGFLFPKTYSFESEQPSADEVIRAMLDQFQAEVAPLDLAGAAASLSERYGIELSEYDVVTMASIVEREAVTDEQRPKVASVFYNRLRDGMRLESDATLTYYLGRAATAEEINSLDVPYNTYKIDGLTPTPVCSPSLASLEAAASPADTSFLYFYITQDTEQFSETYDQHQQAYS